MSSINNQQVVQPLETIPQPALMKVQPISENLYQPTNIGQQPQPTYGWASGTGFYHNNPSSFPLQPIVGQQGFRQPGFVQQGTPAVQPAVFNYQTAPVAAPQPRPYSLSSSGSSSRLSGLRAKFYQFLNSRGGSRANKVRTSRHSTNAVEPASVFTPAPIISSQQTVQPTGLDCQTLADQQGWSDQSGFQQPLAGQQGWSDQSGFQQPLAGQQGWSEPPCSTALAEHEKRCNEQPGFQPSLADQQGWSDQSGFQQPLGGQQACNDQSSYQPPAPMEKNDFSSTTSTTTDPNPISAGSGNM